MSREISQLKHQELVLGTLHHPEPDMPWLQFDFVPTVEFEKYQDVFATSWDKLNKGEPDFELFYQENIEPLNLEIEPFDGSGLTEFAIHIFRDDDEMYCRIRW